MRLDVTEKLLNLKKLCVNLLFRGFIKKANQRFFSNGFVFPNLNAKIELIWMILFGRLSWTWPWN